MKELLSDLAIFDLFGGDFLGCAELQLAHYSRNTLYATAAMPFTSSDLRSARSRERDVVDSLSLNALRITTYSASRLLKSFRLD